MAELKEWKDKAIKHKSQSEHYYQNAVHYIELGDAEKASEFLWGSMSQALKAVAVNKVGRQLKSHASLKDFALKLTKELNDESIWFAFISAQSLHSNFYETGLLIDDVIRGAESIEKVTSELLSHVSANDEKSKNG